MDVIHFTELKKFAVKDTIERGLRYLHCHDSRHDPYNYTGAAHCEEVLTLSHAVTKNTSVWNPPGSEVKEWNYDIPMYLSLPVSKNYGNYPAHWESASDRGLTRNSCNYILDINQLLREGIVVDQTLIPRKPNQPSFDDGWDEVPW